MFLYISQYFFHLKMFSAFTHGYSSCLRVDEMMSFFVAEWMLQQLIQLRVHFFGLQCY